MTLYRLVVKPVISLISAQAESAVATRCRLETNVHVLHYIYNIQQTTCIESLEVVKTLMGA